MRCLVGTTLLASLLSLSPSHAAEDVTLPSPLPLEILVDAVLHHSPQLRERRSVAQAAALRPAIVGRPSDPMVSLEWWQQPIDFRSVPLMVSVRQTIPSSRTLDLQREAAALEAKLPRDEAEGAARRIAAEAQRSYFDLALAERSLVVSELVTATLRRIVDVTEAQYRAGRVPQFDVFRAQAELLVTENDRLDVERARQEAIARLNALLDRPSSAALGPTSTAPELVPLPDAQRLVEAALAHRADVVRARDMIAAAEARLRLAAREGRPELAVSAGYMVNVGGTDAFTLGLSSTLPLFSGGRRKAMEAAEQAESTAARAALDATTRQVDLEVRTSLLRLDAAARHVRLHAEKLVPLADAALESAQASYVAGRTPLVAVLDAARVVREHHLDHLRFLVDYRQRVADLEEAIGVELASLEGGAR